MELSDIISALNATSIGKVFNKSRSKDREIDAIFPILGNKVDTLKLLINKNCLSQIESVCFGNSLNSSSIFDSSSEKSNYSDNSSVKSSLDNSVNSLNDSLNYDFSDVSFHASDDEISAKVNKFMLRKQKEFESKSLEFDQLVMERTKVQFEKYRNKYLQMAVEERDYENQVSKEFESQQKSLQEKNEKHAKLLDAKCLEAQNELKRMEFIQTQQKLAHDIEEKAKQERADAMKPKIVEQIPTVVPKKEKENVSKLQIKERCLTEFNRLSKLLSDTEDSLKDFKVQNKGMMASFLNLIGNSVNIVNEHKPSSVEETYNQFCKLLDGQVVQLPGKDEAVSIQSHPSAGLFCLSRIAKSFAESGDKLNTSNLLQAHATVISSLMYKYPQFGDLFFAYMAKRHSAIIPHYDGIQPAKDKGAQMKVLSRTISFFGYVLVSKPILNNNNNSGSNYSTSGITRAWEWLALILSQDPQTDVTAIILNSFLTAVEKDMLLCYGNQFKKLLMYITDAYLPVIKKEGNTYDLQGYLERSLGRKSK